jgi:hypothetical protein
MTTNVDDEVRTGLQRWAAEVPEGPGDPYGAMRREVRPGTERRPALRWAAVAAAAAVVVVAVAGLTLRPAEPIAPASGPDPTPPIPTAGDPALPMAHPAVPGPPAIAGFPTVLLQADGWQLNGARLLRFTDGTSLPKYDFVHNDGRQFELTLYGVDQRPPGSVPRADGQATVHGQPAVFATAQGPPGYQLQWVDFARMWEADGRPFAGVDEFAATMEQLQVVDGATFRAAVPRFAEAVVAHPDESVRWVAGREPEIEPAATCNAPPPYSCGVG